jgi:hypothetical protein
MPAAVPVIEVTDHAHAASMGRPDGEPRAGDWNRRDVGAQAVVTAVMVAFAQEIEIVIAQ